MKYPSGYCVKGQHLVTFEVRPGIRQCAWCGHLERSEPPAPVTADVQPSLSVLQTGKRGETAQTAVAGVGTEIESRFRTMAREHAANAQHLVNWQRAGNKLPRCYL